MNTRKHIDEFVEAINSKYNGLIYASYELDHVGCMHNVWHTNLDLEKDPEFREFVGKLMVEKILMNNIFNFSFTYDRKKAEAVRDFFPEIESVVEEKTISRETRNNVMHYIRSRNERKYVLNCSNPWGLAA